MPENRVTAFTRRRLRDSWTAAEQPAAASEENEQHEKTIEGRLLRDLDAWRAGKVSDFEFVPLLGQLIRWHQVEDAADEGESADCGPIEVYLPAGKEALDWDRFGLEAVPLGRYTVELKCALHRMGGVGEDLREAIRRACRQELQTSPIPVLGDLWLNLTSHGNVGEKATVPTYKSDGQRRLIRALDSLKPGQVLMGCLPTGEGKSLAIHRLVLEPGERLVVVIVPTVTLAQDQEIEAHTVLASRGLPDCLAYLGARSEAEKNGICERIRDGQQRLVFANPEALSGRLFGAITEAAREGTLGALVIDEAHTLDSDTWDFRRDFGLVPSRFRWLLGEVLSSSAPPKIALLSATLTQATIESLERFFCDHARTDDEREEERTRFVKAGSLRLRPEPAYVRTSFNGSDGERTRRDFLLKVVPLLPRPLYIYSTRVADVEEVSDALGEHGLRRVGMVHGGVKTEEREHLIRKIRSQDLDVVSANTAFGLGLNVPNVRTVVHACVPESLDRFAQEVGRGGRDGRSTLSLMLDTPGDHQLAESLGRRKILGGEAGGRRWRDMWVAKTSGAGGRHWLPVDADERHNDTSENWSKTAIVMMEACGLLRTHWGGARPDGADHDDICVEVLDGTVDEKSWGAKTDPLRNALKEADRCAHDLMARYLNGETPLQEALIRAFTLLDRDGEECCPPPIRPGFADRTSVHIGLEKSSGQVGSEPSQLLVVSGEPGAFLAEHVALFVAARYLDWCIQDPLDGAQLELAVRGVRVGDASRIRLLDASEFDGVRPPIGDKRRWLGLWGDGPIDSGDLEDLSQRFGPGVLICGASTEVRHPNRSLEDEFGRQMCRPETFLPQLNR